MKFLLSVLIFLSSLFTGVAMAQGLCSGGYVIKPGTGTVIKIPNNGEFIIGDWGSAGSIFNPSTMDYPTEGLRASDPFDYHCQMQLTDQVVKEDSIGSYWTVAAAQFHLTHTNSIQLSDNLSWFAKRYYLGTNTTGQELDPIPFSLSGHSASINIVDQNPEDLVHVVVRVAQPIGGSVVTDLSDDHFLRSADSLFTQKALNVSAGVTNAPRYLIRLFCEKKN